MVATCAHSAPSSVSLSFPRFSFAIDCRHSYASKRPDFVGHPVAIPTWVAHGQATNRGSICLNIPRAFPSMVNSVVDKPWWKSHNEVWVEVHSEQEFWNVINNSPHHLIFVDFFATWCKGCQKSYPSLSALAGDDELRRQISFVKVNVDEVRQLVKDQGVKALPYVQMYRKGLSTPLIGWQAVPSKQKVLRPNVLTVVSNPNKFFKLDPNHYAVATDEQPQDANSKAQQLAAMRSRSSNLFEHLMSVAESPTSNGAAVAQTSTVPPRVSNTVVVENPLNDPALDAEKSLFLAKHRREYGYDGQIDSLYGKEIGNRLPPGHHYMDYTGASIYSNSQLEAAFNELRHHVFGNPHSVNPSSQLTEERVEDVRNLVRRFFNADASEYQVVFTKSATGSLKLVGETFPWTAGSQFRYLRENHNSVLGIREYALSHGSSYDAVSEDAVEDWLRYRVDDPQSAYQGELAYSLFAFPAEDNFAGVKYPLEWVSKVQSRSTPSHRWKVLLDAAAYVPTQPLDLAQTPADFVSISFYKIFGYPTGLGALLIRTENVELLKKVFWGGGSVALAASADNFHVLKCNPVERLEDGTVAFLDIIALRHGFEMMERLGGIRRVQAHVQSLVHWLFSRLRGLQHSNGRPLLQIFGKHGGRNSKEVQGGIVNFEVLKPDGSVFSYKTFEREAAAAGLHLRTGCECNPGACYNYVGVREAEVESLAGDKEGCDDEVEWINVQRPLEQQDNNYRNHSRQLLQAVEGPEVAGSGVEVTWVQKPLGTIRVSLGYMSTFEDCYALVKFLRERYTDRME